MTLRPSADIPDAEPSRRQRRRRKDPVPAFGDSITAALQGLAADFLRSSTYKHSSSKGTEREVSVIEFFDAHLPNSYELCGGEVLDCEDRRSPQLDVMIYDASRNHALVAGDGASILPSEALLASIEVKSTLTREEVKKSLKAASALKALRPFKKPLAETRKRGEHANTQARFFHCLFAFDTDLKSDSWLENELRRVYEVAEELKLNPDLIDRLYVSDRGLINLNRNAGIVESDPPGKAFMFFYMHVLNFVTRENARRKAVPYLDYAGRMSKGWVDIPVPKPNLRGGQDSSEKPD